MSFDEIVTKVREGDTDLFAVLVESCQKDVWRIAVAMLGSTRETEEIVHQTFVKAYLALDRYRLGESFEVWVKQIARNVVRQKLRSDTRESRRLLTYRERLLAQWDDLASADREAEFLEALAICRESLSDRQARVLDLRYRESLTFVEIASRIQGTADAVRLMASRSRLALRDCIMQKLAAT